MWKLIFICIALFCAGGCGRDTPTSRPTAPQSLPDQNSSVEPADASRDLPDEVTANANKKTKITAADAVRIAEERFGLGGEPQPEATARLISFRAGYQRALDNVHGDPDLQGPIAFGNLEDLDRDGQCWSVEARYGSWLVITYVDEVGEVIYAFNR